MNKKHTNFSVLLLLIFLLILSFGGFGYYIYQSKLNDKNREIMLNEVKNSVIDRNYKKAYSVAKLLQDKYPQNEDIAMLTNTLAEIANSSPFESKDLQRDSANQILDKIKGQDNTKTNVNENFDIAFNNRYIKDSTITENYSDRNDDVGIEDEDISEFKKSKIPEKIKPNTNPKEEDQIIQSPNPKLSVNDQKNLFNLEKLKKNLSGKSNSENILNDSQKIENDKQNTNLSKEKNSENILKTPDNSKYSNNNNTTSLKKISSNSQKESELSPPSQTIIGKIYRPYSYLIKKELYEILDDINTGRVTLGKNRLKELIKKGLSNKFQKVNELIENSKNKEASNLLLTLIKKDIEPNLINIPKDPYKKEIFQLDKEDKKPQYLEDLKSKVHSIKPIDLENTKSRQQAIKDLNEFLKNNPNDAQASKTLAQANKIQYLEDLKSKVHSIKPIDLENTKSRQQAIKDLNEFLKNNPNDAQASKTLAQANKIQHLEDLKSKVHSIRPIDLENTKSRQQAIKDLNEFLKNNPNDAQASKTLAQANKIQHLEDLKSKVYSIKPIDLENTKSRQQAIKDLNEFLKNNPNDAQASKTLAQAYENNGDLLKAENAYEKIIKLTNTQEDHYKLGIIRFKLKKYEHSIESFDQTIKLDPKHKKALHNKGIALMMLNKNKKAIESFEKAIQIDKNYGTAYYQKGIAEEKNGDMQQAFASFKNAYNLDKNPNYALKAGIVSNNLGNFKQSEEYLNFFNANAKKPNEIAIYNLSIAKFENNKLEESLETINKAIDLNPEKSEYLYLKASINLKKENYQNAISLYSLVIEKNPENTSAYINLAKAYEKSGNKSQAISTLEKIINKNNKLALNNLGILYKKEKNYQKAIEIFEKAIINSDIEAKYNLATTLIEINDNTRAKDLLREYTKLKPNNPEALHALGIIEYNENNNDQTLRELIKKFPNYKKNENIKKIIGI
ncbi:tetratricopeptide repeat protein [Borreliella burgdorferi]|uniref:tetratricopeptide repeat protein n=1 Tax=Borreliella burgdorferi TaxID=139 RepID=UPI001E3DD13E|nr:tetratricopeptide repeat protein [Borreliella burgdorferi]MCD2322080.1 tetratricopeptide repeat protein [Borreliella burgdorferi]MCD2410081.1 tetratricopeptide repeat protein [Borreliella burgdorferi]MCD2415953.1 tetratricopeptide repeat protein [Borreliella burgdorferi]